MLNKRQSLLLLLLCFTFIACEQRPTTPTPVVPRVAVSPASAAVRQAASEAFIHGLPASLVIPGYEEQLGYICTTQTRYYDMPDGSVQAERDYYVQLDKCPATPIE
jgi:hypothetical protein